MTGLIANEGGSITLDNASVQRLMDYGVFHYTDDGWHVGRWPETNEPAEAICPECDPPGSGQECRGGPCGGCKGTGRIRPTASLGEDACLHESVGQTHARMPLVYGSAKLEICRGCGAFRYDLHGWSKWRPKEQLAFALIEDEER